MSHSFAECSSCQSLNKFDNQKSSEAVCGKCGAPLKLHGNVAEISGKHLSKILSLATTPVVVDFWASWCGPCRVYGPEFEKASLQNKNAVFLKINTEVDQTLSGELGIRGIPCTILFNSGKEARRQSGAMSAEQLGSFINK